MRLAQAFPARSVLAVLLLSLMALGGEPARGRQPLLPAIQASQVVTGLRQFSPLP
ncbi:hypothetical protein JQX13_24225 [Archangium violaceum]|uniref:hypothetical protein n=1 Tax=Archangium violaceum TaxID=83451 RepID=UPI00193BBAA8|nr:hypothetical protein [Archangium violaceum]QRK12864.1 hypothetical protein JQX13_24225 [Archangium violaceum]